jgi:phosphoglycolate phosphatase-like HAD superfamily hydrolase
VVERPLAIFDIDGVLADVRHRLHFVENKPKDWRRFFAATGQDTPLGDGFTLLRAHAVEHEICYLSGRPESTREVTEQWLARHGAPTGDVILRPHADFRPAVDYKLEVLRRLTEQHNIAALVDDDPRVCRAAVDAGFHVVFADWMTRSRALFEAQETDGQT